MENGYSIILFCLLRVASSSLGNISVAQEYRLSKDITPDLYDIHIKPYLRLQDGKKRFTFDGQANITLHTLVNDVKEITLHKNLIDISSAILYDSSGNTVQNLNIESMLFDSDTNKLKINLTQPLVEDKKYTLYFRYHGHIRNGMEGFYSATNDNVTWYGITQLHRIDARTVFPCFDEPEFKAKFRMHISRSKEYNSFFNTRLLKSTNEGTERLIDHFEETPLMPTYLVAFLISDFVSHGNNDVKIIMHSKFNNKTDFALEVGMKVLEALNIYTQLPYKSLGNTIMQMVGTNHFPHSGMENWGLVLYKESVLAHEPGYSDDWSNKQNTVSVVVHETAHMWFGNSVTHKWWSYFWLNEALPNYYQYFMAHEMYPEYGLEEQFLVNEVYPILDIDATNSTQPLTTREEFINTPLEIASKFSDIAYSKGASVIRMFRNLMGKENFDIAIRNYLKENHLKTTRPNDLFEQLKNKWPSNHIVDLNEFFKDWTEQEGYPMIIVSKLPNGHFSVKQQRFLLDPQDGSNASLKYTIPITIDYDETNNFTNMTPMFYMNKDQNETLFGNANHSKWVIVNNKQSNYYRVFYDSKLLNELKVAFENNNQSTIHVNNRASIVDDLFTYGRIGLRGYDEVFKFMEYLATETEYLPWQAAFKGLETIYQRLTLAQHNKFGDLLFEILDKVFQKLSFKNANVTILDIYNRNKVISWLCKYHHEQCNVQARAIFSSHLSANTKPAPDLRETLYCAALRNDNSYIYENLKDMFIKQQLASEKEKILRAMGCTRYFVKHHYAFILTNNVAPNLKKIGLNSLYSQTPENIMPVFNLMTENMDQLTAVLKDSCATALAIKDIAQYFTTQEQLALLKQFTSNRAHLFGSCVSILENSIKMVENNLIWSAEHLGKLMNYLTTRNLEYRLSKDIVPDFYDIHLKAYLKQEDGDKLFTFDGIVNITVQANIKNIKKITLHKKHIDILEAILYDKNGRIVENISSGSMLVETLTDKFTVYLLMSLEVHTTYILYFKYQGQIHSDLIGVFRATYDNVNWYGITQMERINARTAFPCFDEPEFKAKFRMHISRPKEYNSVFNTRLIKSTIDGTDNFVDEFEETPLMSTYSIAFLISDFESQGNKNFKLITHTKFKNITNFAYEVGLRMLAAYDNYTQLPYMTLGNSIMQIVGAPRFPHNGMENWGLIMYKHSVLVHEPDYTDGWSNKQYTVTILAHETSHMWFGNSVTFKWWSYFWLNEAFARYYEYFQAHKIYPEYELDKQFVVRQVQQIFAADARNITQPLTSLEESINLPIEIDYKFSGITYAKGAAIVRMFAHLMGKEKFDQAIREYLKENHLRNVVPQDLFKFLKKHWPEEHNVDLDDFFRDWTEQVGYPVVSVSVISNGNLCLRQSRFLLDPNDGSDGSLRYTIPITVNNSTKNNYNDFRPLLYFNKTLEEIELDNVAPNDDWIIFNAQQSNYYRVFYDTDLLAKLRTAFEQHNHSGIHVSNRASIVDDLFAFGYVGLKGYDEVFEFIKYLATETEFTPWYAAFRGLDLIYEHSTLEQHKKLGEFLYEVLEKVYKKLGFENSNDTILDIYNRNQVISWLCKYHHQDCNTKAKQIFRTHMSTQTKPTVDFRETLYCAACRNDETDIYANLKETFLKEELLTEKEKILRTMGCTRYNVKSHYEFILSNSVTHDLKTTGLSNLYIHTPENIIMVLKLMTENVETLTEALQSWSTTANVIDDISNYLTTQEQLIILEQFADKKGYLFGTSVDIINNSINITKTNLNWAATHLKNLYSYLSQPNGAVSICSNIGIVLPITTNFYKTS